MKPFANIIAGEPVALADLKSDINPSDTNDVVGEFACATTKDAEDAVAAARAALPAWSRTTAPGPLRHPRQGRRRSHLAARG